MTTKSEICYRSVKAGKPVKETSYAEQNSLEEDYNCFGRVGDHYKSLLNSPAHLTNNLFQ